MNQQEKREMIHIGICVSDCDPSRFRKDSQGREWLNAVMFHTPNSQFNEYMIKQSVSKEERDSGLDIPICNADGHAAKQARHNDNPQQQQPQPQQATSSWGANVGGNTNPKTDDAVPF